MHKYSLEYLKSCLDTVWVTDKGLPVILSHITGNPAKGEVAHIHFEIISSGKSIVRTLDEVQTFAKL